MKKVLSVLIASALSFGGSYPVLAGALPVTSGNATSNVSTGNVSSTILVGITAQSQILALANSALASRTSLINALVGGGQGLSESEATTLVDGYLSLIPFDANGQPSFGGAAPGDVPGSVSLSVDVAKFNSVITSFNEIVGTLTPEQQSFLTTNDAASGVFLGISGFLRLR